MNINCVSCRNPLELNFDPYRKRITCLNCNSEYPILNGTTPIILKEASNYLIQQFLQHERFIKLQTNRISQLKEKIISYPQRSDVYKQMIEAGTVNISNSILLQQEIYEVLDPNILEHPVSELDQKVSYLNSLEYLRRDWCWEQSSEKELSIITKTMFSVLQSHAPNLDNILFTGAGAGRLLSETSTIIKNIYAVDYSLTMVSWFYKLLTSNIEFYEIETRNILKQADIVQKWTASLQNPNKPTPNHKLANNITYLVSDALNAPFSNSSFSSLASIYFTDTLPLQDFLPEIKRLLVSGGLFYHFGPLNYHFNDINNMLAADEIEKIFIENGFKIVHNETVSTRHLSVDFSIRHTLFNNWSFGAIKI